MDHASPDDTPLRPWLAHYPEGVPHDIDPAQYRSLAALLEESLKKHADRPVSVCMDRWMSYGQLDDHSAALGAWLQARDMPADARVAVMLPNGTLAANLVGGYAIGLAIAWFAEHPGVPPEARLFLITGLLGGLTTFSTFSAEVVHLLQNARYGWAAGAASLHLFGSLAMTGLGILTIHKLAQ